MRLRLLSLTIAAALVAALALPAFAGAYVVGIGDQSPAVFQDSYFKALGSKRTRLITPYDSIFKDKQGLDAWLTAAKAAHQDVLVAFNPPASMTCPNLRGAKGCKAVSSAAYTKAFQAFHKKYPWVKNIQPWNEINNLSQPTAHNPGAVVTYYQIVKKYCRGCKVLGADIQDLPNMVSYTQQILKTFKKRHVATPRLWGMHNYTDTNRFVADGKSSMRKLVKLLPGKIWLTETGGVYRFQPQGSRQTFRPDLARQKKAMQAVFNQATRYRGKIDRVYLYSWFASPAWQRWDSAILANDGQPRPVYDVLLKYKKYFR